MSPACGASPTRAWPNWSQMPGYHIDGDGFVYSDQYSSKYIANLRKQIDRRFYSARHVIGVVLKLLRSIRGGVLAKAALTVRRRSSSC